MSIFSKIPVKELDDIANLLTKRSSLSEAFNFLSEIMPIEFVLIGGMARSQYAPARLTNDIDVLVKDSDFEAVRKMLRGYSGVKHVRGHAWLIKGIEVEILTCSFLGLDSSIETFVFESRNPLPFPNAFIAAKEALILLKLQRGDVRDLDDVYNIIKANPDVELDLFESILTPRQQQLLKTIKSKIIPDKI